VLETGDHCPRASAEIWRCLRVVVRDGQQKQPWDIGRELGPPQVRVTLLETRIFLWVMNFSMRFLVRIEKCQLLCRFENILTEKYKNAQKYCTIFLCVTIHTRKKSTLTEK
jgi:hypothetical protein